MRRLITLTALAGIVLGTSVVCLTAACASRPPTDGQPSTGGLQSSTMQVRGHEREFSYFVPSTTRSAPLPIVIYLHGHGDNMRHIVGKGLMSSASSRWMDVAERDEFLVVYPLGAKAAGRRAKTGWNDYRSDARGNPTLDDIAFIRQLIDFAATEANGDRSRVYVTGMSNGGHMAMRVAMDMAGEVAAVAPIAALLSTSNKCSPPTQPVPILMMHGTTDPIAPFEGGSMPSGRGQVRSARETKDTWTRWNDLVDVKEVIVDLPDVDTNDNSTITKHMRERSPNGAAVVAYVMHGAGHTEPSRSAKMGRILKRVQGNQNRDVEMADVVWEFFRSRSL